MGTEFVLDESINEGNKQVYEERNELGVFDIKN